MIKQGLRLITIFLCFTGVFGVNVIGAQDHRAVDSSYLASLEKWRAERLDEVNGPEGWTTLAGLFWLNEGTNRIGSDSSNQIVLPARAPKFAGELLLNQG